MSIIVVAPSLVDHSNSHWVSVTTWFLLVVGFIAVAARFGVKWNSSLEYGLDDALAILALVFDIGCGIAASLSAANGLGIRQNYLIKSAFERQLKCNYAFYILYIATIHLAKLSIIAFVHKLTPFKWHRRLTLTFTVFITLLWLAEWFVVFFQCSPPRVWDTENNRCIDRVVFWRFVGALNIFTDICLIVLPSWIVISLHMNNTKKAIIVGCFGARVADIIVSAVQLVYTSTFGSTDTSRYLWRWILVAQLVQCMTLITSCIPYLKPLLTSLPSGMYRSDDHGRSGMNSVDVSATRESKGGRKISYVIKDVSQRSDSVSGPHPGIVNAKEEKLGDQNVIHQSGGDSIPSKLSGDEDSISPVAAGGLDAEHII